MPRTMGKAAYRCQPVGIGDHSAAAILIGRVLPAFLTSRALSALWVGGGGRSVADAEAQPAIKTGTIKQALIEYFLMCLRLRIGAPKS